MNSRNQTQNQPCRGTSRPAEAPDVTSAREQFWAEFGVTVPEWRDERHAPIVDARLVEGFVRGTLANDDDERVFRCVNQFKSWAEAWRDVLADNVRTLRVGGDESI